MPGQGAAEKKLLELEANLNVGDILLFRSLAEHALATTTGRNFPSGDPAADSRCYFARPRCLSALPGCMHICKNQHTSGLHLDAIQQMACHVCLARSVTISVCAMFRPETLICKCKAYNMAQQRCVAL